MQVELTGKRGRNLLDAQWSTFSCLLLEAGVVGLTMVLRQSAAAAAALAAHLVC
jgi:hypothetical protein